jgi:hypothetical protein
MQQNLLYLFYMGVKHGLSFEETYDNWRFQTFLMLQWMYILFLGGSTM